MCAIAVARRATPMIRTTRPAAGVVVIAIDRPQRRNALDLNGFRALARAWMAVEDADDVRVSVVTGNGADFCSGADLSSLSGEVAAAARAGDSVAGIWRDIHAAVLRNAPTTKPIICAVEGICFGAGMELAGGTDIRIAEESARFALPEVRHGLVASGGSLARLARQIPYAAAMQLLLTGEPATATRMAELGFLNEVVTPGRARERAIAIARVIASNSPAAVRASKRAVRTGLAVDLEAAYVVEDQISREIMVSLEAVEGARAFAAKRSPSWRLE